MNMSSFHFSKMHGLGNDFVVIDCINQSLDVSQLQQAIPQLAHRYMGIGFDQLLMIEKSENADFSCRIYNADGSEAEQCGNGLRCVARFIHENHFIQSTSFQLATKAGIYPVLIHDYDNIRVTLGVPDVIESLMQLTITHSNHSLPVSILSVGNPHAIIKVNAIDIELVKHLGSQISTHDYFSHGANVGFMQILNQHHIRLRTFERGSGLTNACGSNACAAVVAGITNGWLKSEVQVEYDFGSLCIEWNGNQHPIHQTGPATFVFAGQLAL